MKSKNITIKILFFYDHLIFIFFYSILIPPDLIQISRPFAGFDDKYKESQKLLEKFIFIFELISEKMLSDGEG